jgi:hypothetical protein
MNGPTDAEIEELAITYGNLIYVRPNDAHELVLEAIKESVKLFGPRHPTALENAVMDGVLALKDIYAVLAGALKLNPANHALAGFTSEEHDIMELRTAMLKMTETMEALQQRVQECERLAGPRSE